MMGKTGCQWIKILVQAVSMQSQGSSSEGLDYNL